jgi:hypothetical protein
MCKHLFLLQKEGTQTKELRGKKLLRVYPTGKTFNFPVGHRSLDLCFNKIIYLLSEKLLP